MSKLDDAKIRWIIREMEKGERTEQEIGQVQDVTRQRGQPALERVQADGRDANVAAAGETG